jgi:hypothetical protein
MLVALGGTLVWPSVFLPQAMTFCATQTLQHELIAAKARIIKQTFEMTPVLFLMAFLVYLEAI